MTTAITPTAAEATLISLIDQSYTVAEMIAETGKTAAAVRSMLNRMTKKGLIEGGSTAPRLINGSLKPATPSIFILKTSDGWLVSGEGVSVSAKYATRSEAVAAGHNQALAHGLGQFTLVNKLGRTVSYTIKGDKLSKKVVA